MTHDPPSRIFPDDPVLEAVLSSYRAVGQPERVLCAFSGGADSTALLTALNEIRRFCPFSLLAVHVNHGLRASADRDQRFCAALCGSLGIPLRVFRVSLAGKSEDEARKARYSVLYEEAARAGAPVIALAHHAQDQAETVLMRLMRGTVSGIGGMTVLSRVSPEAPAALWRPLLALLPETLRAFLGRRGQEWMEDETNGDRRYLRNMIRHDLLGPMRQRDPSAVLRIARSAAVLGEESRYLDACAEKLLAGRAHVSSPCACIAGEVLSGASPVLRRRCVRLFLSRWRQCEMPDMDMIMRLAGLAPGESCAVGNGCTAVRTERYLHFLPAEVRVPSPPPLLVRPNPSGTPGDGIRSQAVPARLFPQTRLRPSAADDRIVPFGLTGAKPLRVFLSDRKTEPLFRRYYPVLCLGNEAVWVPGAGAGEKARVLPGEKSLLLSFPGWLPGDLDYLPPQNNMMEEESDEIQYVQRP